MVALFPGSAPVLLSEVSSPLIYLWGTMTMSISIRVTRPMRICDVGFQSPRRETAVSEPLPREWPWASNLPSLSFSFLIYNIRIIIVPASC